MATSMRGLTQYISDIRACRVRELEEKRINKEMAHIRQKFKDGNLDGYQKKKYLSKVVFTYILGYKVDVGHMEAINLISSTKYSEKQIGYLALTLLLHENSDLIRLVINSIRKDLDGSNEVNECLALHAIANIGGKEMAEAISEDVHRLMISATSSSFVKKKAALTLLRLYRKHPTVIPVDEWAERIVSVMDDDDPGVALTVATLVTAIAQDHLDAYSGCYSKAVDRLSSLVFDRNYPVDYVYYKVPNPWMQIKLLRLLQYYPPPDNQTVLESIYDSLQAIIDNSQEAPRNVQHNNAQNAVLFEAINLAIHLDPESSVVQAAAVLLGRFILAKETNVRYLGLDAMAHLAACSTSLDPVKKHQDTIILSLKDRDISVRRRALDLLYSMCDATNAKVIVGELLRYLGIADYNLREEMVLKMAILTERFATEYEWYVDTILQLISSAGDHVGSEVWWRVVQLVTNNEDVQHYAATVVFKHLQVSQCHENLIKVSGAILGEFGHLIANEPGCSPIEQFHALHSKINLCTAATRAMLLTTYLKWVNLFPEIKDQLVNIFDRYRHVLDAELQQRACEYYAIATRDDNDELIQTVCEEMPIYPERESALLSRLHSKGASSQDKRTWVIGGKDENKEREAERFKNFRKGSATLNGAEVMAAASAPAPALAPSQPEPQRSLPTRERTGTLDTMMGASSSGATEDIMSSLAGLDLTGTTPQEQPLLPTPVQSPSTIEPQSSGLDSALFAQVNPAATAPLTLGPNIEKWLERLSYSSEGVLYEDGQLQIGIKAEYHGSLGRLALFFGNKTSVGLTSFNATIDNAQPNSVTARFHETPVGEIGPLAQVQEMIHVECKDMFTTPPILRLSFKAVTQQFVVLKLPIFLCKFVEGVQLDQAAFFERWKIIGGPPREAQAIFPIKLTSSGELDLAKNSKVLGGQRLSLLENIDPNLSNLVVAGVLHMSTAGKVGILGRLEPNKDAKLCRLTIRSTNDEVSAETLRLASTPLNADTAAS